MPAAIQIGSHNGAYSYLNTGERGAAAAGGGARDCNRFHDVKDRHRRPHHRRVGACIGLTTKFCLEKTERLQPAAIAKTLITSSAARATAG